jgi:hypothetical protein
VCWQIEDRNRRARSSTTTRVLPFKATLEPQNYRPPQERELIFSAYDYQNGEVFGVDLVRHARQLASRESPRDFG